MHCLSVVIQFQMNEIHILPIKKKKKVDEYSLFESDFDPLQKRI